MATPKKKAKSASKAKPKAAKKAAPKKAKPVAKAKTSPKPKKVKPAAKAPAKPAKKAAKAVVSKSIKAPANNNGSSKKPEVSAHPINSFNSSSRSNTPPPTKFKAAKNDDHRTRYSDVELGEFKNLIDEKLEAARTELRYLQDQINRKDDNGTDDTENKFANLEDGSITLEREYLTQMAARQLQYLDHLEKALIRIQNKTYGICRVTGKLIDKERLRAVPHATLSMEAKMVQNKHA